MQEGVKRLVLVTGCVVHTRGKHLSMDIPLKDTHAILHNSHFLQAVCEARGVRINSA